MDLLHTLMEVARSGDFWAPAPKLAPHPSAPATQAVQLHITGKVQGVWYRKTTQTHARALGLRGWVQNEPDGAVTAWVEGPANRVQALIAWCRRGPLQAQVQAVDVQPEHPLGVQGFAIRR